MEIDVFQAFDLHRNYAEVYGAAAVNGRRNIEILSALDTDGDVDYQPCAEALADQPPDHSELTYFPDWRSPDVYPDTIRDLWIVAPPEVAVGEPPGLLVFNDGGSYLNPDGPVRAQRVLDVLRTNGSLPPIVGVFLTPGRSIDVPTTGGPFDMNLDPQAQRQRSIEYDSMTPTYSRLLVDEVVPFVEDHLGVALNPDPTQRGIVGISSGGNCSWTAAWHQPDQFGLVVSHCGSFVNIRGGHNWPYLVRSNERRGVRVFMQSGELDANIIYGNWPLANRQMAAALEFAGYDVQFEFGTGGHNLQHAGMVFADSLRWLFQC